MSGSAPLFPPLFSGEAVLDDPFAMARDRAEKGCDAGLILWRQTVNRLEAAMVLAPEVPLSQASQMLVVASVGMANAFGALAPPEIAMHLHWDGRVDVNGAKCGGLHMVAPDTPVDGVPDWLVVGFWLQTMPFDLTAPGKTPESTSLFDEGCAELSGTQLLEAWARHTLVWLHRWEEEGAAPLHAEWIGRVPGVEEDITTADGTKGRFLGVDEGFGMLLKTEAETRTIPLTALLADRSLP